MLVVMLFVTGQVVAAEGSGRGSRRWAVRVRHRAGTHRRDAAQRQLALTLQMRFVHDKRQTQDGRLQAVLARHRLVLAHEVGIDLNSFIHLFIHSFS